MRTSVVAFVLAAAVPLSSGCGAAARPSLEDVTVPVGSLAPAPEPAPEPEPPRRATPEERYADEVDGLIMRLFNEDDDVRAHGARELAAMGRYAGPALPYLRDCERQQDGDSARECADAADYIEGLETATARR